MKVPLCLPSINETEISAVVETLKSGWLAHGEYNNKFEKLFADTIRVKHAITMNSCTSALEIALKANRITGEVIIPSFTWCATANAVVNSGAHPIFCDVDEGTRNVTAETIAKKITSNTEAIIVVHYAGQCCQMDDINKLCCDNNLLLIEDSAETLGSTWKGEPAGSFGIGCFSFFPTKNITTGEGGMFTTNDSAIADKARMLISHGISTSTLARESMSQPWHRESVIAGHNYRMPNPLAALGYCQLQRLTELNNKRIDLAKRYDAILGTKELDVDIPYVAPHATHVYQMYTIQVDKHIRNDLVNFLRKNEIGASVHFDPPVHVQTAYNRRFSIDLPITTKLSETIITLPIYPDMTYEQQDFVLSSIEKFFEQEK